MENIKNAVSLKGLVENGDNYCIDREGNVYSCAKGNEWRQLKARTRYITKKEGKAFKKVCLCLNGTVKEYYIHKLVELAFNGEKENVLE